MQRITLSCLCGLLLMMTAGCSLTVQNELNTEPRQYLADHLFTAIPSKSIETEQQIFALPDAVYHDMLRMVRPLNSSREKADALLNYIFFLKGKRISYRDQCNLNRYRNIGKAASELFVFDYSGVQFGQRCRNECPFSGRHHSGILDPCARRQFVKWSCELKIDWLRRKDLTRSCEL